MPYPQPLIPKTEGYVLSDRTTTEELSLCNCGECPLKMIPNPRLVEVFQKHGLPMPGEPVKGIYNGDLKSLYKIVVVGQAPGAEELKTGLPFTGVSGQTLKGAMDQLGYTGYYLTNALLCEITEDVSSSEITKALFCCSERLDAEVKRHTPDLVIALGNVALESLVEHPEKITKVAGKILDGRLGPTLAVVHPASFLRSPDFFRDFVDQIDTGIRSLQGFYSQIKAPEIVVATEENFADILNKLDRYPELVLDLETTRKGLFPYSVPPDGIRCMVIAVDTSTSYIFPGETSEYYPDSQHPNFVERQELKDFLKGKKLITHNGQFDIAFLYQAGYTDLLLYYDTMLAHIQLDERVLSHGLKALSRKYLGAEDWESDIKIFLPNKRSSYDLIPDSRLYTYAAMDVVCTYGLYQRFKEAVNTGIFRDLIMPCANMFSELRHEGISVDPDAIFELDAILEVEYAEEILNLEEIAGHYVNPKAPGEVATLVYDEFKFPIIGKFGRSTGAKILAYYAEAPVVQSVLRCRQISKLQSTYLWGLATFVDNNFKVHPFTKLFGTVTGRISTEDPSVMNITKKRGGGIKKIYIPKPGHFIVEADQKQMELRCYCAVSGDQTLTKILNESKYDKAKDPHRLVATIAFGAENAEKMRGPAKSGVFGRLYGRGLDSFMHGLKLSREDATHLVSVIDGMFPGVQNYNKTIVREIHEQGYLESYFGRKRRFPLITKDNKNELYRQGSNFKIQSMASDVNLYCMLYLYSMRKKFGATPLFPVHDSIVFDVENLEAVKLVKTEMEKYSQELVGNTVEFVEEVKYGPNWGELKEWKE